jgi:Trp operon repressor
MPARRLRLPARAVAGTPDADLRILQLTREEEKKLLQRLESISSLVDLEHMQQRIHALLGLEIRITPGNNEVRTMRGIQIELGDLPGLCRKTRQSIPAAIRKGLERRPEIAWALLDAHDLFGMPGS